MAENESITLSAEMAQTLLPPFVGKYDVGRHT